ncbi:hypothetical protein BH11ACT1_BH11ACT1_05940 [soil metagenome]
MRQLDAAAELGVRQLDAAAELVEEPAEELAGVLAAAVAGADVVGADEESLDDAAEVEVEDEVPADTVDFDFERESLR